MQFQSNAATKLNYFFAELSNTNWYISHLVSDAITSQNSSTITARILKAPSVFFFKAKRARDYKHKTETEASFSTGSHLAFYACKLENNRQVAH